MLQCWQPVPQVKMCIYPTCNWGLGALGGQQLVWTYPFICDFGTTVFNDWGHKLHAIWIFWIISMFCNLRDRQITAADCGVRNVLWLQIFLYLQAATWPRGTTESLVWPDCICKIREQYSHNNRGSWEVNVHHMLADLQIWVCCSCLFCIRIPLGTSCLILCGRLAYGRDLAASSWNAQTLFVEVLYKAKFKCLPPYATLAGEVEFSYRAITADLQCLSQQHNVAQAKMWRGKPFAWECQKPNGRKMMCTWVTQFRKR